jgi:predicted DNA-binding transcriptional regulator AlpA
MRTEFSASTQEKPSLIGRSPRSGFRQPGHLFGALRSPSLILTAGPFRLIRGERQMATNDPIALTAVEAAKVLGLAESTLAKLRLTGAGPVYCKLGRRVVYRQGDLAAWLESRIARDTSDADTRLPKSLTGQHRD